MFSDSQKIEFENHISILKKEESPELELRIGTFEKAWLSRHVKSKFKPGILQTSFERLLENDEPFGSKKILEKSLVILGENKKRTIIYFTNSMKIDKITVQDKKVINKIDLTDFGFRISFATENEIKNNDLNAIPGLSSNKSFNYRYRFRITRITKDKLWQYDFTKVVMTSLTSTKALQDWLKYLQSHPEPKDSEITSFEVEIEFIGNLATISNKELNKSVEEQISTTNKLRDNSISLYSSLQLKIFNEIFHVVSDSGTELSKTISSFGITTGSELKFDSLVVNPVLLQFSKYSLMDANPENYAITEKADGERHILYITNAGRVYMINNRNVIVRVNLKAVKNKSSLLVGEYLKDLDLFMTYDIVIHKAVDISDLPLLKRVELIKTIIKEDSFKQVSKESAIKLNIEVKTFVTSSKTERFKDIFIKVYKPKKYRYGIDGIIVNVSSGSYKVKPWKWKPSEQLSIDMLVRMLDKTRGQCYVGINGNLFRKNKLVLLANHGKLFPKIQRRYNYFPVIFEPSGAPKNISIVFSSKEIKLEDNNIYEFIWSNKKEQFVPIRHRIDKTENYLKYNQSFGNDWKTAVETWGAIQEPLTTEMMNGQEKIPSRYFLADSNREFSLIIAMRNFHSYIKNHLYSKYAKNSTELLELAGGRGQELNRWIKNDIKHVVLVDSDKSALETARNRFIQMSRNSKINLALDTVQLDLLEAMPKSIRKKYFTDQLGHGKVFDTISMQFAFHYFMESQQSIDTILNFVITYLKSGGYFFLTTFDGDRVIRYLNKEHGLLEGEQASLYKNGEPILAFRRLYSTEEIKDFGQEISVMVGSIGSHNREFLVNMKYIIKHFTESGNLKLVEKTDFKTLYQPWLDTMRNRQGFSKNDIMSDSEKQFSFLNSYLVFKAL